MFRRISETIEKLDTSSIPEERLQLLGRFVALLSDELKSNQVVKLNFICTHNSRRSHLAQVWAQTLADYFELNIQCFSGGTEATAVYSMIVKTLKKQGFEIGELERPENPLYYLKSDKNAQPLLLFSKIYDDTFNPKNDFFAVMTCSDADENCPMVLGAKHRFALTYKDPKTFDGSAQAEAKYLERSTQIATELYLVFKQLAKS